MQRNLPVGISMWFAFMVEELLPAPDVLASPEIVKTFTMNEIIHSDTFLGKSDCFPVE